MTALRVYVGTLVLVAAGAVPAVLAFDHRIVLDAPTLALAAAATLAQWFPVRILRRDGNQDIEASHAFLLAIALLAGPATALAAQVVASLAVNLGLRRPAIKTAFNTAQTMIAIAAAGGVLAATTGVPTMDGGLTLAEIGAFLLAALAYQLVNESAVAVACALADGRPVAPFLRAELRTSRFHATVSAVAPLAAAGAATEAWLVPMMVVPLWALRQAAQVGIEISERSRRDSLTGLPNAVALRETLGTALGRRPVTVAMLDLDGFKDINDTLGRQSGDALLSSVAERLRLATEGRGTLHRLQGDEFVTVFHVDGLEGALVYATEVIESFGEPFRSGELELDIGISAGVARVRAGECSVDELLRRADLAVNEAKGRRLGFALYRPACDGSATGRQVLSANLRRALRDGEIEVHYQPQCSLRTGEVESVEALVRWRRPDGSLIGPGEFIERAERTRVMMPLTVHVLRTAIADCRRWFDDHGYMGRVSINVSARTLHHPSLFADVSAALTESGMDAGRLEIEITESALMADPEGARRTLAALSGLGVGILIDDFGTGYSSMAYLHSLPVDGLKIDRSFVTGMTTRNADMAIVRSTVDLAQNLGLRTIAEGVEEPDVRDGLAALGCDLAQGWLWHPAVPAAAIGEVLRAPAGERLAA